MSEDKSPDELEAWRHLAGKGFSEEEVTLEYNPSAAFEGVQWKCRRSGGTKNFGKSATEAVLRFLAANPTPPSRKKEREASK